MEFALEKGGLRPALSGEQKIAKAELKIAETKVPKKPSPEKGMAMLRRGKAEAGLAGLKAKGRKLK